MSLDKSEIAKRIRHRSDRMAANLHEAESVLYVIPLPAPISHDEIFIHPFFADGHTPLWRQLVDDDLKNTLGFSLKELEESGLPFRGSAVVSQQRNGVIYSDALCLVFNKKGLLEASIPAYGISESAVDGEYAMRAEDHPDLDTSSYVRRVVTDVNDNKRGDAVSKRSR